jgi:hypothetical protein
VPAAALFDCIQDGGQSLRIAYRRPFDECLTLAETIIDPAPSRWATPSAFQRKFYR